jgi:hypothetical protein
MSVRTRVAPVDLELVAGLPLESYDFLGQVPSENERVAPLHLVQSGGSDVLGPAVEPGRKRVVRVGDLRPMPDEQLVGRPPEEECVGCGYPLRHQRAKLFVEVRDLPPALLEAIVQLRFRLPVALHDAIEGHMRRHRQSYCRVSSLSSVVRRCHTEKIIAGSTEPEARQRWRIGVALAWPELPRGPWIGPFRSTS